MRTFVAIRRLLADTRGSALGAALLLSGLLVVAGGAVSFVGFYVSAEEPAPSADEGNATADGHKHMGHGGGAHAWTGGTGVIPTLSDALLDLERRSQIVIVGDDGFNPANGVRSGSGTFDDPWVISGWFVDQVLIADTSHAFEFKGNYVNDILILDWTGQGGYVHHNHLENMRTNRNVERLGQPSATVIEKNTILEVEELRHFDGLVRNNTIGKEGLLPLLANGVVEGGSPRLAVSGDGVVFNIAGLNGAGIHDNTIFGGVDMKIHGHHHSDMPGISSHNHGQPDEAQNETHREDHQVRYVDFLFYNNRIKDDKFGMRYNDLNHAGDDRTATSEQEPDLELPHIHHTRVVLRDNVIEGATLRIATLNAEDERHVAGETATIEIANNKIVKPIAGDGIVLQDVRNAQVLIHDNVVEKGDLQLSGTSAIFLLRFANASVVVGDNSFGAYKYGVRAAEFDGNTTWSVGANKGAVDYPVYWDESVANPPAGHGEGEHAYEHGHEPETLDDAGSAPSMPQAKTYVIMADVRNAAP